MPQPQAWVDVWADVTGGLSYRSQVAVDRKKGRTDHSRHQRANMVEIMAEVVRDQLRKELREATHISLALDGKGPRKVMRFRCDCPSSLPPQFHEPLRRDEKLAVTTRAIDIEPGHLPFVTDGVLGLVSFQLESLDAMSEDHGVAAAQDIELALRQFCTPLGQPFDDSLYKHITTHVTSLAADGAAAARKQLVIVVQRMCPNVVLLIRDVAHAVRIAARDPLHHDEAFGQVWEELFNKEHSVVSDFQHSDKLKAGLTAAQHDVVRLGNRDQRPPLDVILRHFSFAKQRFDSLAVPAAKVAIMLLPVAAVLATRASDMRLKKDLRERAVRALQLLKPKFCMALGLTADFGLLVHAFVRLWDQASHDIAASLREYREFRDRMRSVFQDGLVFSPRNQVGIDHSGEFITTRVAKQLRRECVFQAGSAQCLVWGACAEGDLCELGARMCKVVDSMVDRLRADFDSDLLRISLCAFDLPMVRQGFQVPGADDVVQRYCKRGIVEVAKALQVNAVEALLEYKSGVAMLLGEEAGLTADSPIFKQGNRTRWGTILKSRSNQRPLLRQLIRFYLSIMDGECQVERDLGKMTADRDSHCNLSDSEVSDILVLRSRGPRVHADWENPWAQRLA